ncbi:MAG: LLM class F420-dependent oxidoreductase, partial [Candidatus Limnocylindrales bacterium]
MAPIGLGIQLWAQNTDWPSYLAAAKLVDELGYDHLWTWDHLVSAVGDPNGPVFEGYTTLAAWAMVTSRVK